MANVISTADLFHQFQIPSNGAVFAFATDAAMAVGFGILAALKGFNWYLTHKIQPAEGEHKVNMYSEMSIARICLLGALMMMGAVFYYATLENWGMYYALAAFVTSLFCLPSAEGVEIELNIKK